MMNWIRNDKGNITLLTLGLLGVMVLLFAVVLNLVKVYAVKQQASNAAQQASLAATSEIYRALTTAIQEADDLGLLCPGGLDPWPKTISEQIEEKKNQLSSQHPSWSERELELEAIDRVLAETLPDLKYSCVKQKVESQLEQSRSSIQQAVLDTILSDGGDPVGTILKINDQHRVEVRTSSLYRALKYDEWIPEEKRKVTQVGMGPALPFLEFVDWSL